MDLFNNQTAWVGGITRPAHKHKQSPQHPQICYTYTDPLGKYKQCKHCKELYTSNIITPIIKNKIEMVNNAVDVGVRVELPAPVMEPITSRLYESKLINTVKRN